MKLLAGLTFAGAVLAWAGGGLVAALVAAQAPAPEVQKHIDAAKQAAGADHMGVFQPVCDGALALANPPAPRGGGPGRGRQGGPPGIAAHTPR